MEIVIDNGNVILQRLSDQTENLPSSSALISPSTFSGWNSEIGILPKFDALEIDYRVLPWTQVVVSSYSTNANPLVISGATDTAGLGYRLWSWVFVSDSGSTIQKNISVACAGETPIVRRGWNEREVPVVFSNGKTVDILIDGLTYNGSVATDHASAIILINQAFADA